MHALHSHTLHSHAHHSHSFPCTPVVSPYNPPEEPPTVAEQFAALGGTVIRHAFSPRSYNPGLTHNHYRIQFPWMASDYLMTFRCQDLQGGVSVSRLSLAGVNKGGTVKWSVNLDLPTFDAEGVAMQEDGRLFWFNNDLYLAYSNVRLTLTGVKFKQSLVKLSPVLPVDMQAGIDCRFQPAFHVGAMRNLPYGNNAPKRTGHEKNWQFFEDDRGDLAFVYSINPHIVVVPSCNRRFETQREAANQWTSMWGEMHGGTPPIRLGCGSHLSFFNSFIHHDEHQRRYVIGAYVFAKRRHSYKITHIIDAPLVIGSERDGFLWDSPVYWEPIVAFATGAILDFRGNISLSYGVNDCYSETAKFPLRTLLSRMVRV